MPLAAPPSWRFMLPADLPTVARLSDIVHTDLTETPQVFAERLALFAAGCLVTEGGYAVAHPVRRGAPPPLDTLIGALPDDADTLHIHDVALLPTRRGAGLGGAMATWFIGMARAQALPYCSLIAVAGKDTYWARHGFAAASATVEIGSYGVGAIYMERTT